MDSVPRSSLIASLTLLLCIGASAAPSAAQGEPSPAPALDVAQADPQALVVQLDRLLADGGIDDAKAVYRQLLKTRTNAVEAGLALHLRGGVSSELTIRALCALASEEVPEVSSSALLNQVLTSTSLGDWTKMTCIDRLAQRVDGSFRDLLLRFAADPRRDPNLRISALRVARSQWPSETRPTLVSLLQSAQEPVMHHKALQYLASLEDADAYRAIEQFVLNRDPATAGSVLSKEYGILVLRFRRGAGVLPLLASILRDESWPGEIQERAIDLLARSGLPGGREVLVEIRGSAGEELRNRVDMALREQE